MNTEEKIPRRICEDQQIPAERAINDAIRIVEAVGAHPELTNIVMMLVDAREKMSDFVDEKARNRVDRLKFGWACEKFVPSDDPVFCASCGDLGSFHKCGGAYRTGTLTHRA